jgi:hypothetical protein
MMGLLIGKSNPCKLTIPRSPLRHTTGGTRGVAVGGCRHIGRRTTCCPGTRQSNSQSANTIDHLEASDTRQTELEIIIGGWKIAGEYEAPIRGLTRGTQLHNAENRIEYKYLPKLNGVRGKVTVVVIRCSMDFQRSPAF